ncbi:unnamed protein product [Moneuplotes crassus]|uniref:Uncharacterized protein n=1 Tax=Euplotes crassus TaxID=5936 RepID=A0AAD1XN87_EUPCR|nr:unnamed protein product [Moneuplotes crassus]
MSNDDFISSEGCHNPYTPEYLQCTLMTTRHTKLPINSPTPSIPSSLTLYFNPQLKQILTISLKILQK